MLEIASVGNDQLDPELADESAPIRPGITGSPGQANSDLSRTAHFRAVSGKGPTLQSPFETVIGLDERVRVFDTDLAPWRMICSLRMKAPNGANAIGTGWFVGPRTILTAGHCVFSSRFFGGWASSIEVIPGLNGDGPDSRPFGASTSNRFSSIDLWTKKEDADFDIGAIHIDEPLGEQVGWFGLASPAPEQLLGYMVNIAGYPADRGAGSELYHAINRILRVGERRLFYDVDTFGGQSGAPVWIHESAGAPPIAVGVHAYGTSGTPSRLGVTANSAPRIIPEVLDTLKSWIEQDTPPTS